MLRYGGTEVPPLQSHYSKARLVVRPVEDALLPDVEETDGDEADVDQHLPEAEEACCR